LNKGIKLKLYPTIIGVLGLGLLVLLLSRLSDSSWFEATSPEAIVTPRPKPLPSGSPEGVPSRSPTPQPTITPSPAATVVAPESTSNATPNSIPVVRQGQLRVSNQTAHPVRVVLLSQKFEPPKQSGTINSNLSSAMIDSSSLYNEPAHWDFAPQEGSTRGLILSLPDGNLQVKDGDVLVMFAQDGSRRYWGPYVVGQMSLPVWNSETSEWQLTLQP
jgi:hypothetical protein